MDFHKIQCFLSAAINLNFSRTAEELYLTQPTITAKINSIEEELDVKLFNRNRHSMTLTPEGQYLFQEFSYLLNYYKNIKQNLAQMNSANCSVIRLGYHGPIGWGSLHDRIKTYRALHPEVTFEIQIDGWGILKTALLNRIVDVIFIEKEELGDAPGIESHSLGQGLSAVALRIDHPLAGRRKVKVSELMGEPVILVDNTYHPRSVRAIHKRMQASGVDMSRALYVKRPENALAMTASGQGITYLPRTFKVENDPAIAYVDVDSDEMFLDYSLAWLKETDNKSVKCFCSFIEENPWALE